MTFISIIQGPIEIPWNDIEKRLLESLGPINIEIKEGLNQPSILKHTPGKQEGKYWQHYWDKWNRQRRGFIAIKNLTTVRETWIKKVTNTWIFHRSRSNLWMSICALLKMEISSESGLTDYLEEIGIFSNPANSWTKPKRLTPTDLYIMPRQLRKRIQRKPPGTMWLPTPANIGTS